ncbi:MAG: respiratory nitrate reductase subunit gamma [Bacillota bacterium]|nr:respiratory nitrate reductase subunit gamma [Bacillota bacterium]
MDAFSFWVAGVMVYVAVAVLVLGLAWRLYQWRRLAASPMRLGIFPKPRGGAKALRIVADTLVFPQAAEVNAPLWLAVFLFHLALLGVFVGHLRLLGRFPEFLEVKMSESAHLAGGTMGIVLVVTLFYFLIRRFKSPSKELSVPEDYLLLILLLGVVVMGDHLRLFAEIPFSAYRQYVASLLALRPEFGPEIAASPYKTALVVHVLLANLLFIYLPFSKLVHFIGAFLTNGIRRS